MFFFTFKKNIFVLKYSVLYCIFTKEVYSSNSICIYILE